MAAPKIRGDYAALSQITKIFTKEAADTKQFTQRLKQAMSTLQSGDWIGKGASAFYQEMEGAVFPTLNRLENAFSQAAQTTQQISQIVQIAEEQAAALFRLNDNGGVIRASDGLVPSSSETNNATVVAAVGAATILGSVPGLGIAVAATVAAVAAGGAGAAGLSEKSSQPVTTGNSLVVTGDVQGFVDTANAIIGVQYEVVVNDKGEISLNKTNVAGPLTPEAQELVNTLQMMIDAPTPTQVEFVHDGERILIGGYTASQIDLDDINQLGTGVHLGLSSGSALVHELVEQYRKQVFGEDYGTAHAVAIEAENRASGGIRGPSSNSGGVLSVPYTYPDGSVVTVAMTMDGSQITNINRTVTPPPTP